MQEIQLTQSSFKPPKTQPKDLAKHEQERANKGAMKPLDLKQEFCKVVKKSSLYWIRADEAKSRLVELTQANEETNKKATADVESIEELQETNEVLLEKYQQNEKLLQIFLMRSQPLASPPTLSTSREAASFKIKSIGFRQSQSRKGPFAKSQKKHATRNWMNQK